jgi:predicted HicB family RNase H-like nuclease
MSAKSTKSDSKTTTLYIPKELHSQLKIEAVKRGTSMTQLVIEAIKKELDTAKRK